MQQNNLVNQGFKPLSNNISQILKTVFVKKKTDFLLINNLDKNWQKIVGEQCWQFCQAKKIKFEKNKKANGVLTIAAFNSSVSFYLEANCNQIIENIAAYYGYKIVSEIRIIQEPKNLMVNKIAANNKQISQENQNLITTQTLSIKDLELKSVLEKLGQSILK